MAEGTTVEQLDVTIDEETTELVPKPNAKSEVWLYFGYKKDSDGKSLTTVRLYVVLVDATSLLETVTLPT